VFLVPAATVCVNLSFLHISSHKNHFLRWGTDRAEFGTIETLFGVGNDQDHGERSSPTDWEWSEKGGLW
jgi:hypothetical protein